MNADDARRLRIESQIQRVENKIKEACKDGYSEVQITESLLDETWHHLEDEGFKLEHHEVPYDPDASSWTTISW